MSAYLAETTDVCISPGWLRVLVHQQRSTAESLRGFVDRAVAGLQRLGGERRTIIDEVPQWWIDGQKREPTGRPGGRPVRAKDKTPRRKNVPAPTQRDARRATTDESDIPVTQAFQGWFFGT